VDNGCPIFLTQNGVKTPKKAGSRKKSKAVRQKDNSEGTQPQISSFFGGQEDISNTPKNSGFWEPLV
jgi:hypothetical protein